MNKRDKLKIQIFTSLSVAFLIIIFSATYLFREISIFSQKNSDVLELSQKQLTISNSINVKSYQLIHSFIEEISSSEKIDQHRYISTLNQDFADLMSTAAVNENEILLLISTLKKTIENIEKEEELDLNKALQDHNENIVAITRFNKSVIDHRVQEIKNNQKHISNVRNFTIIAIGICLLVIAFIAYKVFQILSDLRNSTEELKKINREFRAARTNIEDTNWVLENVSLVTDNISGIDDSHKISKIIIDELNKTLQVIAAAVYIRKPDSYVFELHANIGLSNKNKIDQFVSGEGVLGKAVVDKTLTTHLITDEKHLNIETAIVDNFATKVFIVPMIHEDHCLGVLEIAVPHYYNQENKLKKFLIRLTKNIATRIKFGQSHQLVEQLLDETQKQTEELETQQEELRITNEELIKKTHLLESSEEELRVQQEELTQTNTELNLKAEELEKRNIDLNNAQKTVEQKISEVQQASKYKSEFMANMSHELRTPLNSILILAKLLQDNKTKNLSADQTKYASVIYGAGTDLLELINELLDLAKIESGKIDLHIDKIGTNEFIDETAELFSAIARDKEINFVINTQESTPAVFVSDEYRIQQVLKNFLSNAFKFTEKNGEISFRTFLVDGNIHFDVADNGKGISQEKQNLIFEAFTQEDGSTSRRYGGTGLGLSISREIASLLGGKITLKSELGKGSVFSLIIPYKEHVEIAPKEINNNKIELQPAETKTLTKKIIKKERSILIIEDDINFADILKGFAEEYGYNVTLAHDGEKGINIAKEILPDAIILDVMLPIVDGWEVLGQLKADQNTKHIPIHMMSAAMFNKKDFIERGAIGFIHKPVTDITIQETFEMINLNISQSVKKILLIEDQELQSDFIKNAFLEHNINVLQTFSLKSAWEKLQAEPNIDCIILDLNLPDGNGLDFIEKIKKTAEFSQIPIIINTAYELPKEQYDKILSDARATILKSDKSSDRLIDEVNLFLNKIQDESYEAVRNIEPANNGSNLKGKCVLIADDDMRNIFALTTSLESYEMKIEIANNGKEAVDILKSEDHKVDIVLMDIMMPEMDGYEAIKIIREDLKYKNLPILAVTAKAMKEDREKSIQMGANDYVSKPIDIEKLTSLMHIWLS